MIAPGFFQVRHKALHVTDYVNTSLDVIPLLTRIAAPQRDLPVIIVSQCDSYKLRRAHWMNCTKTRPYHNFNRRQNRQRLQAPLKVLQFAQVRYARLHTAD